MKSFLVIMLVVFMQATDSFCQKATLIGKLNYDFPPLESNNNMIIEILGNKRFSTQPNQDGIYSIQGLEINQSYILIVSGNNPNHNHCYFQLEFTLTTELLIIDIKIPVCEFNAFSAKKDIDNKSIKLLLSGGIAPAANSAEDYSFEKKYKIKYHEFGCEAPSSTNCLYAYSKVICAFLDGKYGRKWREKVRSDVLVLY